MKSAVDRSALVAKAKMLDDQDPLARLKNEFTLPKNTIYLDGNSLGALPKSVAQRIAEVVNLQWGEDLITSWNKHSWIDLPESVGEKIAKLIGAAPGQTICCDSISINLFKVISAALSIQKGRHKVISQSDNFPTDLYMVEGLQALLGEQHCRLHLVAEDDVISSLDEEVAVLLLTHVNFRTGKIHDMRAITQAAHQQGILVIWDLAHSAGVLDVQLDQCEVDFAVGCGYKYLNGGPGAPAFIYVNRKWLPRFKQPLTGWMGHKSPFSFDATYEAANGMQQCLAGTPGVISMSALDAAMTVFEACDMPLVAQKSQSLVTFFEQCVKNLGLFEAFALASPEVPHERGSQLALYHEQAYAICQALIENGVIADFRSPNVLRLGFAPLYVSFSDALEAAVILQNVMQNRLYMAPQFQVKSKVT